MANEITNLTVNEMSCSHCENRVKKSVGALKGVDHVRVDLKGKKVTVEYDLQKVNLNMITQAIEDQGYIVEK